MKNQEKSKPTKKKILFTYLIVAAGLLIAAAITLGVVFGVKGRSNGDISLENPDQNINKPDESNKPNNPNNPSNPDDTNNPNEPDKPDNPVDTSSAYVFIVPIDNATLTREHKFGYDVTLDRYWLHRGMDFAAEAGTTVKAAIDGTITQVKTNDRLYGGVVTIQHADGVTTVYKFVTPAEGLEAGAKVNRGDVIGTVMTATGTERKQGDHLHFEVYKNGKLQNPDEYLDLESK